MSCFQDINGSYFDIENLANDTSDYTLNITNDLYIQYNICRFSSKLCGDRYSFANLFSYSNSSFCIQLTNTTKFQGVYFDLINPASPGNGIRLVLAGGQPGQGIVGYTTNSSGLQSDFAITSTAGPSTLRLLEEPIVHLDQEGFPKFTLQDQEGNAIEDASIERKIEASPHLRAFYNWQKETRQLRMLQFVADPENVDTNETNHFAFILEFDCVADQDFAVNGFEYTQSNYTFTVYVNSTYGCPQLSLSILGNFITKYRIIFMIIGLVLGFAETFLGLILYIPSIFFAGFVTGFFPALVCFFSFAINPDTSTGVKVMCFVFSVLLGVTCGLLTGSYRRFGHFTIGAWFGVIIFMILYLAVLYKIKTNPANLLLIIGFGVFGAVFGLGALKFFEVLIIISTSLCGAYLTIRSLSLVAGNFPNEFELAQQIKLGNLTSVVQWQFYLYMNGIFLLAILGCWVQFKLKKRRDRKAKEAETYFAVEDKEENKKGKQSKNKLFIFSSNWNKVKKAQAEKEGRDKSPIDTKKGGKTLSKAEELIERLKNKGQKKRGDKTPPREAEMTDAKTTSNNKSFVSD